MGFREASAAFTKIAWRKETTAQTTGNAEERYG